MVFNKLSNLFYPVYKKTPYLIADHKSAVTPHDRLET